ncbi:MAG TPA: metallophosphoesterase [Anaeromyxobacteraceae bacterium]|nr:metallophosphoesterase [Anaeromyxobacteraceae bacterium]
MSRAAALAVALGLAQAGCCSCAGGGAYTVREQTPPAPPSTLSEDEVARSVPKPLLRVLLLGDFGDDTCQQRAVADAVLAAHRRAPFDLGIHLGDNLYECGPDAALPGAGACAFGPDGNAVAPGFHPPTDDRFRRLLEGPLAPLAAGPRPLPFYAALGNHDVNTSGACLAPGERAAAVGRAKACLEVAHESPLWHMPGRHYVVDRGPARFIVLDGNLLVGDYGGFTLEGEVEFAREATRPCAGRRCFIVAHHPAATAGSHVADWKDGRYRERLRRVQDAFQGPIAAWLSGHDHDLQQLRAPGGYDVFVSGNGSRQRPSERFEKVMPPEARLLFASTSWGFASLELFDDGWGVRFEDAAGVSLQCCRARGAGRCEPGGCWR